MNLMYYLPLIRVFKLGKKLAKHFVIFSLVHVQQIFICQTNFKNNKTGQKTKPDVTFLADNNST